MSVIEEIVSRKQLWHALIDNARAESAQLSDNELVALLMTLQGFSMTEIAGVLENHSQNGYLTQTRGQQLVQSAFRKTLNIGGMDRRVNMVIAGRQGRPRK